MIRLPIVIIPEHILNACIKTRALSAQTSDGKFPIGRTQRMQHRKLAFETSKHIEKFYYPSIK